MPQLPEGFELVEKGQVSLPEGFEIEKAPLRPMEKSRQRVEQRQYERGLPIEDYAEMTKPSSGIVGVLENIPVLPGGQSMRQVKQTVGLSGLAGRHAESLVAAPALAVQRGEYKRSRFLSESRHSSKLLSSGGSETRSRTGKAHPVH